MEGQPKAIYEMTHIDYMNAVWDSEIEAKGKYLLSYYATRYNFTTGSNCYASTETIAKQIHWSKNSVTKWKKYLEGLGWISVTHRRNTSDYVNVRIGVGDPNCVQIVNHPDEISHEEASVDSEMLRLKKQSQASSV